MFQDNDIKLAQPLGPDLPPILYDGRGAGRRDRPVWRGHPGIPVWRLPLRDPYDKLLEGKIADLTNISGGPFAGSITSALFLRRLEGVIHEKFVSRFSHPWLCRHCPCRSS